jgi:hypothetical protein
VTFISADLRGSDDVTRLANEAGIINILVNNAWRRPQNRPP